MKQELKISFKVQVLIWTVLGISILAFVMTMTNNLINYQSELEIFLSKEVSSKICRLKDINRGNQEIVFVDNGQLDSICLPITFEVNKYKILSGDSLYKSKFSRVMTVFRKDNSRTIKLCVIELN